MLLFFDERIPARVTFAMRALHMGSTDPRPAGLPASVDQDLATEAKARAAIFVTYDLDFTSTPLFAAMAKEGICVVSPAAEEGGPGHDRGDHHPNFRRWPDLCGKGADHRQLQQRGCRAPTLRDLPYNAPPATAPVDQQLTLELPS